LKIVKNATRVEVFRVYSGGAPGTKKMPKFIGDLSISGFPVWAQGKDQGHDFASRLADVLSDKDSYSDSFAKCFDPGVAFRAWQGERCVDVVICFQCDNLYVGPPKKDQGENYSFIKTPARARLIVLTKEAFPEDNEVQSLKEASQWN
jgi:hypothetical protein